MINFITPNKLLSSMSLSVKALGLELDVAAFCSDVEATLNYPRNMRKANRLVGDYIPDDLAVCISSTYDTNAVCRKYGVPVNDVVTAAAVALDLDSRYKAVLILSAEHLYDHSVIKHELVHWDQVRVGDLVHCDDYITWTRPGEFYRVAVDEDVVTRRRLGDDLDSYLNYELSKPWELEAYGRTTPQRILESFSVENRRLIEDYRARVA